MHRQQSPSSWPRKGVISKLAVQGLATRNVWAVPQGGYSRLKRGPVPSASLGSCGVLRWPNAYRAGEMPHDRRLAYRMQ
jgi:hypothetical protein